MKQLQRIRTRRRGLPCIMYRVIKVLEDKVNAYRKRAEHRGVCNLATAHATRFEKICDRHEICKEACVICESY